MPAAFSLSDGTETAKQETSSQRVGVGEPLLAAARERATDLLVMGGYVQAPWRGLLFGGATREVVGTSLLPLLLYH